MTTASVTMHEPREPGVILAVDIGTTSTKCVAYDLAGQAIAEADSGYPLDEPEPGYAEQDPDAILTAVVETVRTVSDQSDQPVLSLAFSTAMHSLIGLDPNGVPLTPSITWADGRASAQAERLRTSPVGLRLHRRTGTPVHPMSPLTKLVWFREQEPKLCEQVGHWVGIKEYVLLKLCEALIMDHSVASGTGLMNIYELAWDAEALHLAGIVAEQLPELATTTTILSSVTAEAAEAMHIPMTTKVVIGAGDGPLANLGLGAVKPGVAACSIGTSGALRVMVERPSVDPHGGVFCYALTEGHWAVGGAINNGGIVLAWAADALAPGIGPHPEEQLLALAEQAPAGCDGLLMLPYLLSERAPHWSSVPRGAYVGLTREHRQPHLIRAALEGVCQQLALVLESVRAAGNEVVAVRATGGFARSAFWRQLLADVLDIEIEFPDGHEGSSFGAALLGMQALGVIDTIDIANEMVEMVETVRPDPTNAATYRRMQPIFSELYYALTPAFASLRRLNP